MKPCRDCGNTVSEQAPFCPSCGAPYPWKEKWDGWGFEYESPLKIGKWPLLHICLKYRVNRMPKPAKGIFAVGQFAMGVFTLSQFGLGVVSVSQFTVAAFALAQFALAYDLVAQMGVFLHSGRGQMVVGLFDLIAKAFN